MTQTLRKTEERIEGATGLNLFVRSWRPEGAVCGVVVIIPCFNAHSGYYAWAGEQFATDGLASIGTRRVSKPAAIQPTVQGGNGTVTREGN
jgi:alpha-beta hydrolase superfamily lysophospholipase